MSLLLTFATKQEAHPFIEGLQATPFPEGFQFTNGYILITGMGMLSTLSSLSSFPYPVEQIYNIGIAGTLSNTYSPGEIVTVHSIGHLLPSSLHTTPHGKELSSALYPEIKIASSNADSAALLSSPYPIYSQALKKELQHQWDLVDMEGYATAFFCKQRELPLTVYKGISDFAEENEHFALKKRLYELSEKLFQRLCSRLIT